MRLWKASCFADMFLVKIFIYLFFYLYCEPWRINWMKNVVYITPLLKKSIFKSCNSCIKPRLLNPNSLKHTRIIQTTCQQIFPSKNMVWQENSSFYCNSIFKSCKTCIKPWLLNRTDNIQDALDIPLSNPKYLIASD